MGRGRPFGACAVLLALLCLTGPARAQQPLGRFVEVDGRWLHLHCIGSGEPTVMLEAGMGGSHLDWLRVQTIVGRHTRTCSYDRAGYGWSDAGPKPRTAARAADELDRLLAGAGIAGPVLIAGHSFGGLVALRYAAAHPGRMAGLVLVDSMHPDQYAAFAAAGIDLPTDPRRVVATAGRAALADGIPEPYKALAIRFSREDKVRSALFSELRNAPASAAEVRALALPHLPARVLVHGRPEWDAVTPDGRMERLWREMQARLASALGAPPPVVVRDAGHAIQAEEPAFVAWHILALLGERAASSTARPY